MQIRRSIICEECKLPRSSKQWFDVCDVCVRQLPKVGCAACGRKVRRLLPEAPLCLRCAGRLAKQKIVCEKCGLADYPVITDPGHCRRCHLNARSRRNVKLRLRQIICCACGLTKTSLPNAEMICKSCYEKRRTSKGRCTVTGCRGSIRNKKLQLCNYHNHNRRAPKLLSKYIKNYDSPFPQNVGYFLALTAKSKVTNCNVDERKVGVRDLCRYRAVGEYLKSHELPEMLSWPAIHEAMPKARKRGQQGRIRVQFIRSGLLELGNQFLQEQLVQHQRERLLEKWLRSAPVVFVEHVAAFEKWASEGMLNPKLSISLHEGQHLANTSEYTLKTIKSVIIFLKWCVTRDIYSLAHINESTAASYKETLFWQLECSACRKRIPLDFAKTSEICSNQECQAINSYVKIRRLARASVMQSTMRLRTFFNWARLHDVVSDNPFAYNSDKVRNGTFTVMNKRGQMIEIAASIRRYDDNVVERLCNYMASPDADPEEALVLYLIFFHLLTVTELRNAKIPSLVAAENPLGDCDRARDFEYLLLPVRQLSRGRHLPTREGPILKYAKEAMWWLRPLLERYFEKRGRIGVSEYLFVGQYQLTQNTPVGPAYFNVLVHRASQRVLNGMVNPRDLRNTAAAIRADRSKRRGAILTKLGYTRARSTRFNYLETFLLEPKAFKRRQPPAGA